MDADFGSRSGSFFFPSVIIEFAGGIEPEKSAIAFEDAFLYFLFCQIIEFRAQGFDLLPGFGIAVDELVKSGT